MAVSEFNLKGIHYRVNPSETVVVASISGRDIGDHDDMVDLADAVAAKILGQCSRPLNGELGGVDLLEYRAHKGRRQVGRRVIKP